MVADRTRRRDQFLGPDDGLELFEPKPEKGCEERDGRGGVEVVVVGSPAKCGTQVSQLDGEPGLGLALTRTVPAGKDIGLASGEVVCVRGAQIVGFTSVYHLLFGELADGLQHGKPCLAR